jgi:hypothetical protein
MVEKPHPSTTSVREAALDPRDLPDVVPGVDPVEFAPLMSRQRTQSKVVPDLAMRSETFLALRQYLVHGSNVSRQVAQDLVRR